MDTFIHVANVLLLASFLVRDILWLRLLNVCAGIAFITCFATATPPGWAAIGWNVLFLVINLAQMWRLFVERRPVRLSADELTLYRLAFRSLTPREFTKLVAIGQWLEAAAGEELVAQGVHVERVLVLQTGAARVLLDGAPVAELTAGQLVGEMGFLTETATSASVVATEPTRYFAIPSSALRDLLKAHPELRIGMQGVIGKDLVTKLRAAA